jgi:hypothetical protein
MPTWSMGTVEDELVHRRLETLIAQAVADCAADEATHHTFADVLEKVACQHVLSAGESGYIGREGGAIKVGRMARR